MPHNIAKNLSLIAAIDLGSNSFHMVVAKAHHTEIRILERLGEARGHEVAHRKIVPLLVGATHQGGGARLDLLIRELQRRRPPESLRQQMYVFCHLPSVHIHIPQQSTPGSTRRRPQAQ